MRFTYPSIRGEAELWVNVADMNDDEQELVRVIKGECRDDVVMRLAVFHTYHHPDGNWTIEPQDPEPYLESIRRNQLHNILKEIVGSLEIARINLDSFRKPGNE